MSAEERGRQDVAGLVNPQAGQATPEPRERGAHAAGLMSIGVILRCRGTRAQDHERSEQQTADSQSTYAGRRARDRPVTRRNPA